MMLSSILSSFYGFLSPICDMLGCLLSLQAIAGQEDSAITRRKSETG